MLHSLIIKITKLHTLNYYIEIRWQLQLQIFVIIRHINI